MLALSRSIGYENALVPARYGVVVNALVDVLSLISVSNMLLLVTVALAAANGDIGGGMCIPLLPRSMVLLLE